MSYEVLLVDTDDAPYPLSDSCFRCGARNDTYVWLIDNEVTCHRCWSRVRATVTGGRVPIRYRGPRELIELHEATHRLVTDDPADPAHCDRCGIDEASPLAQWPCLSDVPMATVYALI